MLKRILLGLGGADYAASAIRHAVELATTHGAEVTGVSILDEERLIYTGPLAIGAGPQDTARTRLKQAKERGAWAVEAFVDACRAAGVKHQVLGEVGEPFSLWIDQARYHDLMVFGLRSLFEFDVIPDPHDALARLVQAGVRPLIAVAKEYRPVQKALIAYSGSMESAKAMKRFVQLRLWPEARLRIVNFGYRAEEAEQLVGAAADYCRTHGFEVEEAFVPDTPKEHLLPYAAKWGADLMVVGNSATNLLLRRILGETALHVIQNADRPLFLAQ